MMKKSPRSQCDGQSYFPSSLHTYHLPMTQQKAVDDAKVSQYTAGKVKKSRREKEQEAAEAKKREEEANAAKAYAEFLDAFEGEDVGKKNAASNFVKASGEAGAAYTAARGQPERQSRASGAAHVLNRVRVLSSAQPFSSSFFPPDYDQSSSPPSTAPKPKGKRAMDAFLEEIKKLVHGRIAFMRLKLILQRTSRA